MPKTITVKSVLNKTKKRDTWFLDDYTLNPYSSCSYNCLYCYIRGSKYGEHLANHLKVKSNALEVLEKQLSLRARKQQFGFIVLSSATDPYLPIEEETQLTRQMLSLILKYRFPVHIITKSTLIERDFDLLEEIDRSAILPPDLPQIKNGTIISYSFSTLDDEVGKIFEPGAPAPSARLNTLKSTCQQGFLTGVSLMPLLPYISDTGENLEFLFDTFQKTGAHYILPATITLFGNEKYDSKHLVLKAIEKHYPELLQKYRRFFAFGHQMPQYYQVAFKNKMKELSRKYGVKDRIESP